MAHAAMFGVGSFHFGWTPPKPESASVSEYSKALRTALESLQTISNVEIDSDDAEAAMEFVAPLPNWNEGQWYYPPLDFFFVRFQVFIARRLQTGLLGEKHQVTDAEKFLVYQTYGLESPVTFVRPIGGSSDFDPSDSVQLVREYLRHEFEMPRNGISFQCLGPSPLHADFFLKDGAAGLSEKSPFVGAVEVTDAFDRVNIAFDSTLHRSVDHALEHLYFELTGQLSFLYAITAADVRAVSAWEGVMEQVEELVNREASTRFQRLKRWATRGRDLSRLHQTLAEFEQSSVVDSDDLERSRRQLYRSRPVVSLQPLVDAAMEDRWQFPLAQVEKLIGHVEARRTHEQDLLVTLMAAIVGGLVGSVITLLVK